MSCEVTAIWWLVKPNERMRRFTADVAIKVLFRGLRSIRLFSLVRDSRSSEVTRSLEIGGGCEVESEVWMVVARRRRDGGG
jgi:hypothetical protein